MLISIQHSAELIASFQIPLASTTKPNFHHDRTTTPVVGAGGDGPLLRRRDGGVPRDQHGHRAAAGPRTKGQRLHVAHLHLHLLVTHLLAARDGGLDRAAVRRGLVRVDALAEIPVAVEQVPEQLPHLGDARGPGGAAHVVGQDLT
jgi:hypothetical protein